MGRAVPQAARLEPEIGRNAAPVPGDHAREPVFGAALVVVEFAIPVRLDPSRAPIEPEAPAAVRHAWMRPTGWLGSVGLHLLPLLLLLDWSSAPADAPTPIPVQLVIEQPPPPPPPPQPEPKRPPPGRLASENMGKPAPPQTAEATPQQTPEPSAPAPVVTSSPTLVAPPIPLPAPNLAPLDAELRQLASLAPPSPPKPTHAPRPPAASPVMHRPEPRPHASTHPGRIPGPEATRDEYLAYILSLTRRHMGLLPASLLAGRRGETVLTVLVLGDGTIARISVAEGSGYPDIDARIEQMVGAVGRFPPLPPWFPGSRAELSFRLRFPEALSER